MTFFVMVRGPLGVGKTTVSSALAKAVGARVISVDELVEAAWDGGSARLFRNANREVESQARASLAGGMPVVVDGCFYWKSQIKDLERRLPFAHRVFTLKAPLSVCIERDAHRPNVHGAEAAELVYRKCARFEYGISLDSTRPLQEILAAILAKLPIRMPTPLH